MRTGRPIPPLTLTADEILASVARFCHRISNSGHSQATEKLREEDIFVLAEVR